MQLSARILTALAVLAFAVAIVASRGATDEVSAATGTIDAMNVGACTTTNSDALGLSDCKDIDGDGTVSSTEIGNTEAFYEANELGAAIEVDELYATYAHDPKTAAEAPRGIIQNGDLIKVSIKDTGRDRRDAVLIGGYDTSGLQTGTTNDPVFHSDRSLVKIDADGKEDKTAGADEVAKSLGIETKDLVGLKLETPHFDRTGDGGRLFPTSGSYTIVFEGGGSGTLPDYKPIAPNGVVKFFGKVATGDGRDGKVGTQGSETFKDLSSYIKLDEDVISGGPTVPPAMVLNVSVPTNGTVGLHVIYYQTSEVEDLFGGDKYCTGDNGVDSDGDCPGTSTASDDTDDVIFTSDEKKNNTPLLVQATSDGNHADVDLYLTETGRFDGVYEGYLRLTDADGDGDGGNWGRSLGSDDGDADGANVAGAAVLGVGSGPVVINYRDTNGNNQSFTIQIDIDPPVIAIDSPVQNSRSDDEKPSFIGTINDGDSGLAADTFQLYVDNVPTKEDTDTTKAYKVLSGLDASVYGGGGADVNTKIDRRLEYTGYSATASTFGVIAPGTWRAADIPNDPGKAYKSVEADSYSNGAPDGEFADEIEIDFDERSSDFPGFNHAIEFQGLVRDLAGNVGFSDSDPAKPRFINDLGEKSADRKKPNVLGVFSLHTVWLDEVDPYIHADRTVTGFYGLNDDKAPIRDRSSVMVVFDDPVNGDLIDSGTFTLEDDDGNGIAIADVMVKDQLVFLKLDEELASSARPNLSLTEGREVEDFAGNILGSTEDLDGSGDRTATIKVRDGILPVFTVTLSGGSGTGSGGEGSAKLTKEAMDIAIESDEDINGAPKVAIVCSNIGWTEGTADKALSDYVGNRTGYDADEVKAEASARCGDATKPDTFNASSSLSRPGNNWVYAWRNAASDASHLPDGGVTIVVWGRDRNTFNYYSDGAQKVNYGSETATFTLDNTFDSPLTPEGGDVQPDPNSNVDEARPFILLDFAGENTSVSVTKLSVDGADVLGSLDSIGDNRFLYWPEALDYGDHTVEFDARDAADNAPSGGKKFTFKVTQRDPFVLDISAGWNAISFPANPVDTALDAVFTDEAIDRVVGWNPMSDTGPWSIASRVDGVWTTSENFAPLTDVAVRYGYWVHSMAFIKQSVDLEGPINRETGGNPHPIGIQTIPGWNFVGVVDQDGDQTEGHWDDALKDSEGVVVAAKDYMPGFVRAYTWYAIGNGYRVLGSDDPMKIGQGIWVFFPDGTTVAP